MLRRAREAAALTTADCLGVKHPDALAFCRACLPYVDIFMPNEDEAMTITGATRCRRRGASRCASSARRA